MFIIPAYSPLRLSVLCVHDVKSQNDTQDDQGDQPLFLFTQISDRQAEDDDHSDQYRFRNVHD